MTFVDYLVRLIVAEHSELLYTINDKLDTITDKLNSMEREIMTQLTDALDQAEAAAAANSSADDSAEALLVSLSAMVQSLITNQTDPTTVARVSALADALKARAGQLAAAVTANTPAAPAPAPTPTPTPAP